MTETVASASVTVPASKSFAARIVGVVVSPRATYADVAAHPRWLGALAVVLIVSVAGLFTLMSTDVGKRAMIDQQTRAMESFGVKLTEKMRADMDAGMARAPYVTAASQLVVLPIMTLIIAGILFGVFSAVMGGDAKFKQVFAIVAHAGIVTAAGQIFVLPLDYVRESLSSPTTLAAFVPMLDENSFPVRLLGSIDLVVVWWLISLAIGLGVLYKRKTAPIATTFLTIYIAIGLIVAIAKTALAGA